MTQNHKIKRKLTVTNTLTPNTTPKMAQWVGDTKRIDDKPVQACAIYPVPTDEADELTLPVTEMMKKRQTLDGKSIDDWLRKQRMTNESLYRNQEVLDSDIMKLEFQMRHVMNRLRWLEVVVVCLVISFGGLLVCVL